MGCENSVNNDTVASKTAIDSRSKKKRSSKKRRGTTKSSKVTDDGKNNCDFRSSTDKLNEANCTVPTPVNPLASRCVEDSCNSYTTATQSNTTAAANKNSATKEGEKQKEESICSQSPREAMVNMALQLPAPMEEEEQVSRSDRSNHSNNTRGDRVDLSGTPDSGSLEDNRRRSSATAGSLLLTTEESDISRRGSGDDGEPVDDDEDDENPLAMLRPQDQRPPSPGPTELSLVPRSLISGVAITEPDDPTWWESRIDPRLAEHHLRMEERRLRKEQQQQQHANNHHNDGCGGSGNLPRILFCNQMVLEWKTEIISPSSSLLI